MIRAAGLLGIAALLVLPPGLAGQSLVDPGAGDPDVARFEAAGFQETLLEFRVGRLTNTTVRAFSDGSVALLPATVIFQIVELEHDLLPSGILSATLYPENRRILIDPDSGTATRDEEPVEAPDGWIIADGTGEIYVATPVLEALLDLVIITDWADLAVVVRNPDALPLGRRIARQARWDMLRGRSSRSLDAYPLDLHASAIGGAVLDWGLSVTGSDPRNTAAHSLGLGARVLNGSLRVTSRSVGPTVQGQNRIDTTWETVFDDLGWLTQLRVGDGLTTGPRMRSVRGLSLSNAPYLRGSFFGTDVFQGRVGPGWEVELRQSGQTLDLLRADEQGAFALDIPLRYGENAVQVVAFGPHGEVVTTEQLLLLGQDRLPAGTFEWGLSGGECRSVTCRATGNLDLRYGLSNRVTLQAGAEGFTRDTLSSVIQPYVGATAMVRRSIQLSGEAVRAGFLRGGLTVAPSPSFRLRAFHTAFSSSLDHPTLHDTSRRGTTEADLFLRPDPGNQRLYLRASALRQALTPGTLSAYQTSLTVPLGSLVTEVGVRREVNQPSAGPLLSRDFQFGALRGVIRLSGRRSLVVRGELEYQDVRDMERARAQVGYQLTRNLRLEVGAFWQRVTGHAFTVSLNTVLPQLRSITQLVSQEDLPTQVTQFSQGTVHWNEATSQLGFSQGPGLERGGLAGYVFLDENGNGERDPEEEDLEGVRVVVGSRAVTTDRQGRHVAWDLIPFEPVEVWADSASIADPTLVPVHSALSVRVPPASFGRVNVPVIRSREIMGSVVLVDGDREIPLPYAQLELIDTENGSARPLQAFSDGEFYEAGIRPGLYELRLSREYLDRTGVVPEAGWIPVPVQVGDGMDVLGPIVLRVVRGGTP
ncbi:MAG TPA: hypothetical protein VLA43_08200 [Longimicrobiales bacterium]|nr:hypothetical protein [Longimicrobiales bacterium]